MKKVMLLFFVLLLCLMAACTQQEQPSELPTVPTETTVVPPKELVEATDDVERPDLSWLPAQTEELSMEEYFVEDRPYQTSPFWLVEEGEIWKGYCLKLNENGLHVCAYDANPWDETGGEVVYKTPKTADLSTCSLVGTNGIVACLLQKDDVTSGIFMVDLVSGERTIVVQNAIITDAFFYDDVVYYAVFLEQEMQIVCHYLPTGSTRMIPTGQTIPALFSMEAPESTCSDVIWHGITQVMSMKLTTALEDTNSQYKHPEIPGLDLSYLWEENSVLVNGDSRGLQWVCYFIQQETGTWPLCKAQCDVLTGEQTMITGVIDNCWFGSGYAHDHYDPDAPAPAEPISNISQWQPFVEPLVDTEAETLDFDWEIYRGRLYKVIDNVFTLLTDIPLRYCMKTEILGGATTDAYYAIAQDDTFIRIYTDDSTPTVLYRGQSNLRRISYGGDVLYLRDGNAIIQFDLQTQQYRAVFSHEDLSDCYCDSENMLFISLSSGLHEQQYLYDLSTGEFTKTHRL